VKRSNVILASKWENCFHKWTMLTQWPCPCEQWNTSLYHYKSPLTKVNLMFPMIGGLLSIRLKGLISTPELTQPQCELWLQMDERQQPYEINSVFQVTWRLISICLEGQISPWRWRSTRWKNEFRIYQPEYYRMATWYELWTLIH
jgi:hypothetical protein